MIACISPSLLYSNISLATLSYAEDVQSIKNSPVQRYLEEQKEKERKERLKQEKERIRERRQLLEVMMKMLSIRPNYFNKFQCDGKSCGSRCCKGWRITVDRDTYAKYESINNEYERKDILSKLERIDDKNFSVKMRENWDCPFLDEDYLCKIQKQHGADYLIP